MASVAHIKGYLAAGDIYQANLAQRWTIETAEPPINIYRRLCRESPAEYAAFFQFENKAVLAASPELFLRKRDGRLLTRPIKGTRPRCGRNPQHDVAMRQELLSSEKDQAELAMIVDLLRNDLGRVSEFGTVRVTAPRVLETFPTLFHTVAEIQSTLRPELTWGNLIRALLPAGSITGAPKIRAMQIIHELEKNPRELYCGNIGWISPGGKNATLNVAIRTILMEKQTAHVWAGAGIVADSIPDDEFQETIHKAAALLRALQIK